MYTETFPVSVTAPKATTVVYGILYGGSHHVVFISVMCMYIESFPISVIAPNATLVVYGILYGGIYSIRRFLSFLLLWHCSLNKHL